MSVGTKYPLVLTEMSAEKKVGDVKGVLYMYLRAYENTGSGALLVRNVTKSQPYSLLYRYLNRATSIKIDGYIKVPEPSAATLISRPQHSILVPFILCQYLFSRFLHPCFLHNPAAVAIPMTTVTPILAILL